jgi:hypothetical protein
MRHRLQRLLPSEETLRKHRSLRWLGPLLRRPWLWHLSRRRVAAGAAIGVFFGFVFPVLQIAAAAAVAIVLRANIPVAAVSTLVSNPFTYVPIWVLAHQTGAALLGEAIDEGEARKRAEALADTLSDAPGSQAETRTWVQAVLAVGKPLLLGLFVFAVIGAVLTWVLVNAAWTLAVRMRRRRRR